MTYKRPTSASMDFEVPCPPPVAHSEFDIHEALRGVLAPPSTTNGPVPRKSGKSRKASMLHLLTDAKAKASHKIEELRHRGQAASELPSDIALRKVRVQKLQQMGQRWYYTCGALHKRLRCEKDREPGGGLTYYDYVSLQAASTFDAEQLKQFTMIQKDVHAGRCDAASFSGDWKQLLQECQKARFAADDYVEQARLEIMRVLQAYVHRNRCPGYVQGMSFIVGVLLCFMPEVEAFWTFCTIVEDIRPRGFYSVSVAPMEGFHLEQQALGRLVQTRLTSFVDLVGWEECQHLVRTFAARNLICLFVNQLPVYAAMVLWESFFCRDGEAALIRTSLALFAMTADSILGEGGLTVSEDGATMQVYQRLDDVVKNCTESSLRRSLDTVTGRLNACYSVTTAGTRRQYESLLQQTRLDRAKEWVISKDLHAELERKLHFDLDEITQLATLFQGLFGGAGSGSSRLVDFAMTYDEFLLLVLDIHLTPNAALLDQPHTQHQAYDYKDDAAMSVFRFGSSGPELQRLVEIVDVDRCGFINFRDLLVYLHVAARGTIAERILFVFEVYDRDEDGVLNVVEQAELTKALLSTAALRQSQGQVAMHATAKTHPRDFISEISAQYDRSVLRSQATDYEMSVLSSVRSRNSWSGMMSRSEDAEEYDDVDDYDVSQMAKDFERLDWGKENVEAKMTIKSPKPKRKVRLFKTTAKSRAKAAAGKAAQKKAKAKAKEGRSHFFCCGAAASKRDREESRLKMLQIERDRFNSTLQVILRSLAAMSQGSKTLSFDQWRDGVAAAPFLTSLFTYPRQALVLQRRDDFTHFTDLQARLWRATTLANQQRNEHTALVGSTAVRVPGDAPSVLHHPWRSQVNVHHSRGLIPIEEAQQQHTGD